MQVNAVCSSPFALYCVVDVTDDNNFGIYLESFEQISLTSTSRKAAVDHLELAKRWDIHLDCAKATIQRTTQRGVRIIANPALSRRFRTNDRMLRYRRLRHPVFTDTMFSNTYSRQNNKCAQVFASDFGWVRVYPMKTKGKAHEALSLMFQREGVPLSMVMDGSKEQTLGKFRRKLVDAHCQLKQTEPYSPWKNAAKREIKELKKGLGPKMLTSGAPRRLWDDCLELEAYIQSHSTISVYRLDGEVPETYMSGETANISQFCELVWYNWIKYRPDTIEYPDESLQLGRYLGPAIDVGPAMTAKILQQNGEVVYRSTYRPLTVEEQADYSVMQSMVTFDQTAEERQGDKLTHAKLEEVGIPDTPEYLPCVDEDQNETTFPDLDEEVTPEVGDKYIHASVMLHCGSQMMRGTVKAHK